MLIRSLEPIAGNRPNACFGAHGEGLIVPKGSNVKTGSKVEARAIVIGIKILNQWACAPSLQRCVIEFS